MTTRRSDWEVVDASNCRVGVGGGYFNPPDGITSASRPLIARAIETSGPIQLADAYPETFILTELYDELVAQLGDGELLFALYQHPRFSLAPYVYDVERLSDFEKQVVDGSLIRCGYFAVAAAAGEEGLARDFH